VIYGDNASGKSGYARILRNAVAARVHGDVLGDVFAGGPVSDMTAIIEFTVGRGMPAVEWKWPGENQSELAQVHFYDEDCGDAYVSTSSEISYRPSALGLMDQLITVCDAVRSALDECLRVNLAAKPNLPGLPADTKAAKFLATLNATTQQGAVDAAIALPENSGSLLGALLQEEARLKASDPTKERSRLIELSSSLTMVTNLCEGLANALSAAAIVELTKKRTEASQLRAAATMASSKDFDAEPGKGVGSATWRALWQAARVFSETEAYHHHDFPVTDDGSHDRVLHPLWHPRLPLPRRPTDPARPPTSSTPARSTARPTPAGSPPGRQSATASGSPTGAGSTNSPTRWASCHGRPPTYSGPTIPRRTSASPPHLTHKWGRILPPRSAEREYEPRLRGGVAPPPSPGPATPP
jgi:hypothetical protein